MIRRILTISSAALALAWVALAVASYTLVCLRGFYGNYTFPLFKPTGEMVDELQPDGTRWLVRDEQGTFTTWQVGPDVSDYVNLYSPGVWIEKSSLPFFSITVIVPTRLPMSSKGFDPSGGVPYILDYFTLNGQLVISICFWFPITVFSIAPLVWLTRKLRRRRRRKRNLCVTCGYNLRGNTSGRCPECGTPVPTQELNAEPRN